MLSKTVLRRGSIALICAVYFLTLAFFDLVFALQHKAYIAQGGEFTAIQSIEQANTLLALHQNAMSVAWIGFALCTVLILYIHKKVR